MLNLNWSGDVIFEERSIYRVIQEALSNAVKHSNAKKVKVLLDWIPAEIIFSISDDGNGFDVHSAYNEGVTFGLVTMRERVEALNGHLVITSELGKGTKIQARIPFGGDSNEKN